MKRRRKKMNFTVLLVVFVISTFTLSVGYSLLYERLSVQGTGNLIVNNEDTDVSSKYLKFSYTTNSWYSGGKYYYQVDGVLENISEYTIEDWKVVLQFKEVPEIQGGWNGELALDGKKIIITPVIYNETINANSNIKIGFQVILATDILEFNKITLYGTPIGVVSDPTYEEIPEDIPTTPDDSNNDENQEINPDEESPVTDEPVIEIVNELHIETSLKAEWASSDKYISQHNLILTNNTEDVVEDWVLKIKLPEGVNFSQIWGGNYINADGILKISGIEYSQTLQPGASTNILVQFESLHEGYIPEFIE